MYALIALGAVSLALCLVLTPLCRDICLKLDLVDHPDNDRKIHKTPIPRIGGVAIALSYVGALAFMLALAPKDARIVVQHRDLLWSLAPAAAIIFLTGLTDDLIGLRPWQKLSGQFVAAVWAVAAGARIDLLHGQAHAALITVPLSVFWLLACTNAFNLIDGLDGLASGVGLFATLTTLLAAILQGNWGLAMATVPLLGALLGFLRYNFNPASVFLGDCGSLSIGFFLGCFSVIWSQKSATFLGMLAPMIALALPLFDVSLSIGRRFLRNQPIFSADRGHIHHRLLALGFQPRAVALILYAVCGVAAVLSLLESSLSYHIGGLCIILFCSLSWFGIKRLGYVEFSTASRVVRSGGVLRLFQQEIYLESLRDWLSDAETASECWAVIVKACGNLEFSSVHMSVDGEQFDEVFDASRARAAWQFTMCMGTRGRLTLTRSLESGTSPLLTSFFQVLQECLESERFTRSADLASLLEPSSVGKSAGVAHKFPSSKSVTDLATR
ncbi:MAG: undecaprenyl/decaprenyl-phosphate alpha-N-acetylglucosaminyl 1-phosphate transferase [Acidobacteriota bacterium]|nr:undecaprenyl/decaprenyl-phosphate alpha-N-acetylglucosaminyl 1-phosphate transferase [Acidobacteriota bacterium]